LGLISLLSGRGDRESTVRFGLSPEELGVIIHQLPHHPVEFIRRGASEDSQYSNSNGSSNNKLVRIAPQANNNSGVVSFVLDYEKDGVTGVGPEGPFEVHVQLGEFQVIHELMRTSIPIVTGWSTLLESGVQHAMQQAVEEQKGGSIPNPSSKIYDYQGGLPF
jgi:hypothetical protein